MSYNAKVYKVFIASPDDVQRERQIISSVLMRWNDINAENKNIVLLPVGWETHAAPETGKTAQEYINEDVLDKCDILIGVFWTKIGTPTQIAQSGTIEEIQRHLSERKMAMLYFSTQDIPSDADLDQVDKVRKFKNEIKKYALYGEYADEKDLEMKLYNHLEIKVSEGKFRTNWDSDILAKIKDDNLLAKEIYNYYPLVSKNLLKIIINEDRNDEVWNAIVQKLTKSPADLRDSMIYMAQKGAFHHKVYQDGYLALAKCSQHDFGNFLNSLYSINRYEFFYIFNQNLLEDSSFKKRLIELIEKDQYYLK